jgi:enediyne biosynthesis thioesterase
MVEIEKYYEYHHLVTFDDTNSVGNVYFARFFQWMGSCREVITAEHYPELVTDIKRGFGFATEFAHIDYAQECFLFDKILIKMKVTDLSRTRIEFSFDFVNEKKTSIIATGKQAVIWVNPQHRPSIMPDKLYDSIVEYFDFDS